MAEQVATFVGGPFDEGQTSVPDGAHHVEVMYDPAPADLYEGVETEIMWRKRGIYDVVGDLLLWRGEKDGSTLGG